MHPPYPTLTPNPASYLKGQDTHIHTYTHGRNVTALYAMSNVLSYGNHTPPTATARMETTMRTEEEHTPIPLSAAAGRILRRASLPNTHSGMIHFP